MCCIESATRSTAGHRVPRRAVDVVGRQVGGRVSVRGPAEAVDDLLDLFLGPLRGRSAGHDVLQHVAQAGAQVAALVGAAGVLHVAADRGHRGNVVLLDNDRQAVRKGGQGHGLGQTLDVGVGGRLVGRRLGLRVRLLGPCLRNCQASYPLWREWSVARESRFASISSSVEVLPPLGSFDFTASRSFCQIIRLRGRANCYFAPDLRNRVLPTRRVTPAASK